MSSEILRTTQMKLEEKIEKEGHLDERLEEALRDAEVAAHKDAVIGANCSHCFVRGFDLFRIFRHPVGLVIIMTP